MEATGVSVRGFAALEARMLGIEARIRLPRPWLYDSADKMGLIAAAAFHDEGPAWAPLKPSTLADRKRKGFAPGPILVRTGKLRDSATAKGPGGGRFHIRRLKGTRSIEVGTSLPYARFHEFGTTRRMRARPFYTITLADSHLFTRSACDYVMGRWERAAAAPAAGTGTPTGAAEAA